MVSYQLDFYIEDGCMNTFLIGSKDLFEKVKAIIQLLSEAIDIKTNAVYKMVELENRKISYSLSLNISYPSQMLLGSALQRDQIDSWFNKGMALFLSGNSTEEVKNSLNNIALDIKLNSSFVYVDIPEKKIEICLEDLKKLSILLFKKLDYFLK